MISLTTLIAFWGAGLSTYLAVFKSRPFAHIRYDNTVQKGMIDILVENRGDVDVIVHRTRVLFSKDVKIILGDSLRETILFQVHPHEKLVRAGANCTITIDVSQVSNRRKSYLALIFWRRLRGFGTPTFPLLIRLPLAQLERVYSGS